MTAPRYAAYKDSRVRWLGDIPTHWGVLQSRRMFAVRSEPALATDQMLTASQKYGVLFQKDFVEMEGRRVAEVIMGTESLKHVEPDDFIISMRSFQGGLEWSRLRGSTSFHYVMVKPVKCVHPPFFAHLFKSVQYIQALRSTTDLIRDGQELRYSNFVQVDLPLVPVDEQAAIATFLDRETAKIDDLVEEQRRLIELLKEKRQVVISQAVTKGLNPNVPMKESGVEWLGKVPKHWEMKSVKHCCLTTSGGTPSTAQQDTYYTDETGIPWVRTMDLSNDILTSVEVYITERALQDTACKLLPPGTVMVAMYGGDGTVGKNGLLGIPAAINQAVCGLLPSDSVVPEFMFRYMQFFRPFWMVGAESSRKDPNISQERVRNAPVLLPPKSEQLAIVEFLFLQSDRFDALSAEAQQAVELLQERRAALITAAVTGKIDVRGQVPQPGAVVA